MRALIEATNEELMQELLHRMQNFSKYDLLLGKWNNFDKNSEGWPQHAIMIQTREVG